MTRCATLTHTMPEFDFDALHRDVVDAAKTAFLEVTQKHPEEDFCAFALYTDDGAMTVCPAMNTTQFLEEMQEDDPDEWLSYKFGTAEWPFEGVGADKQFNAICDRVRAEVFRLEDDAAAFKAFKRDLIETCVQALETLRKDFFADQGEDFLLLFAISDGEESKKTQRERVARLNGKAVVREFKGWLDTW